jgi:hypothetical protein
MVERIPDDFDNDEQQEQNHRACSDCFVLPMPVWMIGVWRLARCSDADEPDEVRGGVGE